MLVPKYFVPPFIVSVAPLSTISNPAPVSVPPLQVLLPVRVRLPVPCSVPPERFNKFIEFEFAALMFNVPLETFN